MAIDTAAKRAAVGGVPFEPLGVNVTPGTLGTFLGRAAAAWNYGGTDLTPPVTGRPEGPVVLGDTWVPQSPELGDVWG